MLTLILSEIQIKKYKETLGYAKAEMEKRRQTAAGKRCIVTKCEHFWQDMPFFKIIRKVYKYT